MTLYSVDPVFVSLDLCILGSFLDSKIAFLIGRYFDVAGNNLPQSVSNKARE